MKTLLNSQFKVLIFVCLTSYSIATIAGKNGISSEELKNLKMISGSLNPTMLNDSDRDNFYKNQHQRNFSETLGMIGDTAEAFNKKDTLPYKLASIKQLLPALFHHDHIAMLALELQFSVHDSPMLRAKKFIRLALWIRDIYRSDNHISRTLGLLDTPEQHRIKRLLIPVFVAHAFRCAVLEMQKIEKNIPFNETIDFELSLAQIMIWQLLAEQHSVVHILDDFIAYRDHLEFGKNAKHKMQSIIKRLKLVRSLLEKDDAVLPTVYTPSLRMLSRQLTDEQKYEMIKMHKEQLDAEREKPQDPMDILNNARGFNNFQPNPLDYFTEETDLKLERMLISHGVDLDEMEGYKERVRLHYALNKLPEPQDYFSQEIVQRYLERGSISRFMITKTIKQQIKRLEELLRRMRASINYYIARS